MLVLSRHCDSEIQIGTDITITVLEVHKRRVKLGIEAPTGLSVRRGESLRPVSRGQPFGSQQSCSASLPTRCS